MHTWPIAKSFGAWVLSILVVCGVLPLFGCADAGLTVTLTDWPVGASEVRIQPSLDGTPGSEIVLTPGQSVFVVRVPQGQGGVLSIAGLAYDGAGCKVASGTLEQALPRGLRPYADAQLTLSALSPMTCTLTLTVQGSGSAKAQWAAAGGTQQQLNCVEGAPCTVDVPLNSSAPITVTISARETSRREYPSIAGGCVGLHDCQLRMDRAQKVTVRMMQRQCSPTGFCVYNPLPYAISWTGIWGSGPSDIWAVGRYDSGSGAIAHFDGQSWSADPPTAKISALLAVWGSGPGDVWAVGTGGAVLHYDGTSWNTVNAATNNTLRAVWGTSSQDVWVAGDVGTIRHWDGISFGTPATTGATHTGAFNSIWGSGPSDVWVVGETGWAWRWNGTAGSKVNVAPTAMALLSVWGRGPNDVWATSGSGPTGMVIRWDGTAWSQVRVQAGVEPAFSTVFGLATGTMWLGGVAGSVVQGNAGIWSPLSLQTKETLRAGWAASASDFWLVGDFGTILHSDGRNLRAYSEGYAGVWLAQWGTGPDDIWLAGRNGAIVHWDGIKHTLHTQLSSAIHLNALVGLAKNDVYVFGTQALIGRFNGSGWFFEAGPSGTADLVAGWASGPTDVWASGSRTDGSALLLRKTTGLWGEVATMAPLSTSPISGLHGTSATDLWICNRLGALSGWNGTTLGSSTSIPLSAGTQFVNALWTAPTGEAWVAAGNGGVFMRSQRGGTWTNVAPSSAPYYYSVCGASKSDVWVGDGSGYASHWDGTAWNRQLVMPFAVINALFLLTPTDFWLSANQTSNQSGVVLRYVP